MEYLIRTYSDEGYLVLDNCSGSGTVGIACENTHRKYILIEKDERYFNIGYQRLLEHVKGETIE
jgi:site-specific DNA-methyltransferase (adenine-specific)